MTDDKMIVNDDMVSMLKLEEFHLLRHNAV
jgi:hypothetical protein